LVRNTRSLFIGPSIAAMLMRFSGRLYNNHQRAVGARTYREAGFSKARTHCLSIASHRYSGCSDVVQIDGRLIHVGAIALEHPRLAVINHNYR
jgi:hypothetical protein